MNNPKPNSNKVINQILNEGKFSYPLYKYNGELKAIVNLFMSSFIKLPKTDPIHAQLKSYNLLSEIRMIFESNRIENAGMNFSETKKLIREFFPEIPSNYINFRILGDEEIRSILAGSNIKKFIDSIESKGLSLKEIVPTIKFGDQSRAWIEVARHNIGYLYIESKVYNYFYQSYAFNFAEHIKKNYSEKMKQDWIKNYPQFDFDTIQYPLAFSEEFIKELHRKISEGLLPDDAQVAPGEYRIDDRAAGVETVFVSPQLIVSGMSHFILQSNSIIDSLKRDPISKCKWYPIDAAAKISHQLVRIHPFPDFNGRLSRLILVYTLKLLNVPFAVSLRGGAKDKSRYINALKKADLGNPTPYEAIIAKSIIDSFLEIDSNLEAIGIKSFRKHIIEEHPKIPKSDQIKN